MEFLADREINEAVAKKLGNPDVSDYCHSVGMAWEIVEYTQQEGWLCHIGNSGVIKGMEWWCRFWRQKEFKDVVAYPAWAPNIPMAICHAFLQIP